MAELLCHTVKSFIPTFSDPTTAATASHAPEDTNTAMNIHHANVSSVNLGMVSFRHAGSADETDARKDLRTAHRQSYIPAIGNNNGHESLVVAKELLSSAFNRKPWPYPNASIDLT